MAQQKATLQSITQGPSYGSQAKAKSTMDLKPIQKVLGDQMPALTPDPLGRYRLMSALSKKFGPTFRSHPDSVSAIHHFEKEYNYFKTIRTTLSGKGRFSGGSGHGGGNSNG